MARIYNPFEIVQMMADTIIMTTNNTYKTSEKDMWDNLFEENICTKFKYKIKGEIKSVTNYQAGCPFMFTKVTGVEPLEEFEQKNRESGNIFFEMPPYENNQTHIAILSDYILRSLFYSDDLKDLKDIENTPNKSVSLQCVDMMDPWLNEIVIKDQQSYANKVMFFYVTSEYVLPAIDWYILDKFPYPLSFFNNMEIPLEYTLSNTNEVPIVSMGNTIKAALACSFMMRIYRNVNNMNAVSAEEIAKRVFNNLFKWFICVSVDKLVSSLPQEGKVFENEEIQKLMKVLYDLTFYFATNNFSNMNYHEINMTFKSIYNKFCPFFLKDYIK